MSLGRALRATLFFALVLSGCNGLDLPKEETPSAGTEASNYARVAAHLRSAFKDRASSYDLFEISGFRWVHAIKGWSWLVCVRFQDQGHQRTYALFIKDNAVVDNRYAVETDNCDAQTYSPFDPATGALRPANVRVQQPLY